jgi:hypothetical protein
MAARSVSSVLLSGSTGWRYCLEVADLEAGGAEGALHGSVIFAGAFDEDDEIAEVMLLSGLVDAVDGGVEVAAGMVESGGLQEGAAVEVREQVAGASLGAVDGDNAEMFRADGLDAGGELAIGLEQLKDTAGLGRARGAGAWHGILLEGNQGFGYPVPKGRMRGVKKIFFRI